MRRKIRGTMSSSLTAKLSCRILLALLDCTVVDLSGQILCPGLLINIHLIGGGGEAVPTRTPVGRLTRWASRQWIGLGTDSISPRNPARRGPCIMERRHQRLDADRRLSSPALLQVPWKRTGVIDRVIGVKCAISDHRSPHRTFITWLMAAGSRVGSLLGDDHHRVPHGRPKRR